MDLQMIRFRVDACQHNFAVGEQKFQSGVKKHILFSFHVLCSHAFPVIQHKSQPSPAFYILKHLLQFFSHNLS